MGACALGWAMSKKRQGISASVRWQIFARDNFTCRYCGIQAGQDGVQLHVDHVLSVVDGGDNRMENLVSACQKCNGGKSGRSLLGTPHSEAAIENIERRSADSFRLVEAIQHELDIEAALSQNVVDIKCQAYEVDTTTIVKSETTTAKRLLAEFGPTLVIEWYRSAASNEVREVDAIRYVCGCARKVRAMSNE